MSSRRAWTRSSIPPCSVSSKRGPFQAPSPPECGFAHRFGACPPAPPRPRTPAISPLCADTARTPVRRSPVARRSPQSPSLPPGCSGRGSPGLRHPRGQRASAQSRGQVYAWRWAAAPPRSGRAGSRQCRPWPSSAASPSRNTRRADLDRLTRGGCTRGSSPSVRRFAITASVHGLLRGAGEQPPLVVILDGVTDPQNLGALVRSTYVVWAAMASSCQ